jgi:hypothetical protein
MGSRGGSRRGRRKEANRSELGYGVERAGENKDLCRAFGVHLVNSTASAQFHWNIDGTHFLVKSKSILQVSAGWSLG